MSTINFARANPAARTVAAVRLRRPPAGGGPAPSPTVAPAAAESAASEASSPNGHVDPPIVIGDAPALKLLLRKDLRAAAESLTTEEARYLVDCYYQWQKFRIGTGNQVAALTKAVEPHAALTWTQARMLEMEGDIRAMLDVYTRTEPTGLAAWSRLIVGIGPVLAAGFRAHLDVIPPPTLGHWWRFAGLDPTVEWRKGEKRPWNASLKLLCVRPDQRVTTRRGYVPISGVVVGDEVLTHTGNWRRVTEVFQREYDGEMIGLRARHDSNRVAWVTPEHPVYVLSRHSRPYQYKDRVVQHYLPGRSVWDRAPSWQRADEVRPKDLLYRPIIPIASGSTEESSPLRFHLDSQQTILDDQGLMVPTGRWTGVAHPRGNPVPPSVLVDALFAELAGLFVAEGHVSGNTFAFSFHEDEEDLLTIVEHAMAVYFGLGGKRYYNRPNRSVQIVFTSKPLAAALVAAFGADSRTRCFPMAWLSAAPEIRVAYIRGVFLGDGSQLWGKEPRLATISETLARQVCDTLRGMGISAAVHTEPDEHAYRVLVHQGAGFQRIIMRGDLSGIITAIDGASATNALTSNRQHYAGSVYNLEVEGDHSYVVEGLAVHNCWKASESWVRTSGNPNDVYGHVYLKRKAYEQGKNEAGEYAEQARAKLEKFKIGADTEARGWYEKGLLPPAHIHARAKRYTSKLFLAHFWEEAYWRHYGKAPPLPYALVHLGHAHKIERPNPGGGL